MDLGTTRELFGEGHRRLPARPNALRIAPGGEGESAASYCSIDLGCAIYDAQALGGVAGALAAKLAATC